MSRRTPAVSSLLHRHRIRTESTDHAHDGMGAAAVRHHSGMNELVETICDAGHVASAGRLQAFGVSRRTIAAALASGMIQRVARGIFACAHLDGNLVRAARAGGQVDCVTVLAQHRVWSGTERPGLHLRMDSRYHQRHRIPGAVVHWAERHRELPTLLEVAPLDALLMAIRCLPPDDALAAVESALHLRFISEDDLSELLLRAPERLHSTLARLDRGAQSGYETVTRLKLVRAGFRVYTQFYIVGAGHFDLLVNGCVAVETDGEEWHGPERFLPDRTKDLIAEGQNIRVLRIARPHIYEWWPQTLHTIEEMVRGAENDGQVRPSPPSRS